MNGLDADTDPVIQGYTYTNTYIFWIYNTCRVEFIHGVIITECRHNTIQYNTVLHSTQHRQIGALISNSQKTLHDSPVNELLGIDFILEKIDGAFK